MKTAATLTIVGAAAAAAYVLANQRRIPALQETAADAIPEPLSLLPSDPGPLVGFDLPAIDIPLIDFDLAPAGTPQDIHPLGFDMPKLPSWKPPPAAAPYLETIERAERAHALPSGLLARVLHQESRFRPDIIEGRTKSPAGALGIAQFMPQTARERGVDPLNPHSAINGAARYLSDLFDRFGDWTKAVAAYNWGQGNVARKGLSRAPAETRAYVAAITKDIDLS